VTSGGLGLRCTPLRIPNLESSDVTLHRSRLVAQRRGEALHRPRLAGNGLVAGVAYFSICGTAPKCRHAVVRQTTVVELFADEVRIASSNDSLTRIRGATRHNAPRSTAGQRDERAERVGQVGLDASPRCRQCSPTRSSWPPSHQAGVNSASRLQSRRRGTARKCSRPLGSYNQWATRRPAAAGRRGCSRLPRRQRLDRPRPGRARDAVASRTARRP
jgi:hypothetical protein